MSKVLEIRSIFIAHTGAEKMDAAGYQAVVLNDPRRMVVLTPNGRRYRVDVRAGKTDCNCPYFADNAICKHVIWCADKANDTAEEAYHIDETVRGTQDADDDYLDALEQGAR